MNAPYPAFVPGGRIATRCQLSCGDKTGYTGPSSRTRVDSLMPALKWWQTGTYTKASQMNHIQARCGCMVVAEGAPNSSVRKAQERRTCGSPRCESGLPKKFTDRECAAYVWMWGKPPWLVDLLDKSVNTGKNRYKNLIEFAQSHGWEG